MRRAIAGVAAVAVLLALTAVPSQAQPDGIGDLPQLGFAIEPHEGFVGDTVEGWVDTDDVEEHCITDAEDFVGEFIDLEGADLESGPWYGPLSIYLDENYGGFLPLPAEDGLDLAVQVAMLFPLGLALDLPAQGGTGELVEAAMGATFVMAFADIETASPHNPRGNFSPSTGEGSTPVPELEPGLYPVISTCVALDPEQTTLENFEIVLAEVGAWIDENIAPPYPEDVFGEEFAELAGELAPMILEPFMSPLALGIEFYCILDENGVCAEPPADLELIEEEAEEIAELEAAEEEAAEAVTAAPAFTG